MSFLFGNKLDRFESDIISLTDLIYECHYYSVTGVDPSSPNQQGLVLGMRRAQESVPNYRHMSLEYEDISQQVNLTFLEAIRSWEASDTECGIGSYVVRVATWSLRDWYSRQVHSFLVPIYKKDKSKEHFSTLQFLLYSKELSDYERYVLYNNLACGKTYAQLSKSLYIDRDTLLSDLRKMRNDPQNTGRSSKARPRACT